MKRKIFLLLAFLVFFNFSNITFAETIIENKFELYFEEEPIEINSILVNNSTYCSLRDILHLIGFNDSNIKWSSLDTTIFAENDEANMEIVIPNSQVKYNNKEIYLENKPIIYKDRTYVALRELFSILPYEIFWDEPSRSIFIESSKSYELPLTFKNNEMISFDKIKDDSLQRSLEKIVNANKKWTALTKNKNLCIGMIDLKNPYKARYAQINENKSIYSASLPKIAVLLTVMNEIKNGKIKETQEISAKIEKMMNDSNNKCASDLIDLVGFDKIKKVLTDPQYKFYDNKEGGLWVGKKYASNSKRYPDPVNGLSHSANVKQVCKFYYLLLNGNLINYNYSKKMLDYMDDPRVNNKFVSKLKVIAPEAVLYRKYGDWHSYHSDSVLIWDVKRKYIFVAIVNDRNGENILRELVVKADNLLVKK